MLSDTKNIEDNVLEALKNDNTLAGYVRSFTKGDIHFSGKLFPFVMLGEVTYREGRLLASGGTLIYTVKVYGGTRSLAPGVAYGGIPPDKKGVAELCNDIVNVIRNNNFSGAFVKPVADIKVKPSEMSDSAETICISEIVFDAEVWFKYR